MDATRRVSGARLPAWPAVSPRSRTTLSLHAKILDVTRRGRQESPESTLPPDQEPSYRMGQNAPSPLSQRIDTGWSAAGTGDSVPTL